MMEVLFTVITGAIATTTLAAGVTGLTYPLLKYLGVIGLLANIAVFVGLKEKGDASEDATI